jgi:hypothetical protein
MLLVSVACNNSGDDVATNPTTFTGGSSEGSTSSSGTTATTEPQETSTTPQEESSTAPSEESSGSTTAPAESSGEVGGSVCGDGMVSGNEECDCGGIECTPQDFGEVTCQDVDDPTLPGPITGGVLGCNPASCRYDTSLCVYCGDGEVNGNELCETGEDVNTTCAQLGAGVAGEVVCGDNCQIDTSGCTNCAFEFDFESDVCPLGFSTASLQGGAGASSWACGDPTVYGLGPGAAAPGTFATNLSGPYNANEISALISPEIDTSVCTDPGLVLTVRHWHNFEGGDTNADGGIVQVSEDGVAWTTIAPTDGDLYDMDSFLLATYPPVNGEYGFGGNADENSWGTSEFDLSAYAGSNSLQVRFVFGSNGSTQQGGWYIDWLTVLGSAG